MGIPRLIDLVVIYLCKICVGHFPPVDPRRVSLRFETFEVAQARL